MMASGMAAKTSESDTQLPRAFVHETSRSNGLPEKASETSESLVEHAKPGTALDQVCEDAQLPLSLCWSYGISPSSLVHNVSQNNKKIIFYVSNHTGILYDCNTHKQCLLCGHSNSITATAVSGDRRWLATADIGRHPVLNVWDSYSAMPVQTYYDGLGQGTQLVAMSHCARYIASISTGVPQIFSLWEWTNESTEPLASIELNSDYGMQVHLSFNSTSPSLLVSNSDDQVVFYKWDAKGIFAHSTPVSDKEFGRVMGLLSQSCFISSCALTGTSEGCVVVWSGKKEAPEIRKPVKLIKLHSSPITVVTTVNQNTIVTGDSAGQIKFFDTDLKLLNWYDSFHCGPILSISFENSPSLDKFGCNYPQQCTLEAGKFVTPDFLITTTTASVLHVTSNGSVVDTIFHEHDGTVNAMACHPFQPRILIGSYSGKLKLWDYSSKIVILSKQFPAKHQIETVAFDPTGEVIGVGFTDGQLFILDALSLDNKHDGTFQYSRDGITKIVFSSNSQYLATADLDLCVTVYMKKLNQNWDFLAKYKSHHDYIHSLLFCGSADNQVLRLMSFGNDRKLVEYDVLGSVENDLKLVAIDCIEQTAIPIAATWFPDLSNESFIITANDEYKLKLYNSDTKMCRKTLLGPTFGSPLKKLVLLPIKTPSNSASRNHLKRHIAYINNDKVGLLAVPHDGNPHNTSCLIAHPGLVTELVVSYDGKYLFTAGGEDCTINMWTVNTDALEAATLLGGSGLDPFYDLIPGGRNGELFSELEQFFYYAQIKSQGPNTIKTREASTTVPLNQIPNIMRAIGYYPSEKEVENMLNEVKFSRYSSTGKIVSEIGLEDFIKLYINHRPVFGLSPATFSQAFKAIGSRHQGEQLWSIDRGNFLALLVNKGEHMTEEELVEQLMVLMGYSCNPEEEGWFSDNPDNVLSQQIPQQLTAKHLAEDILGLST